MRTVELSFPAPNTAISTNAANAMHWSRRRRELDPWKESAFWTAKAASVPTLIKSRVSVTIPFKQNRKRDPHNYTGTVVKAIVDGLVLAKVWPDDDPRFVTVTEPALVTGSTECRVLIEEIGT